MELLGLLLALLFSLLMLGYFIAAPFLIARLYMRAGRIEQRLERLEVSDDLLGAQRIRLNDLEQRLSCLERGVPAAATIEPALHGPERPAISAAPRAPEAGVQPAESLPAAAPAMPDLATSVASAVAPAAAPDRSAALPAAAGVSLGPAVAVTGRVAADRVRSRLVPEESAPDASRGASVARLGGLAARLREQLPRQQWEAVIGTSWLNKIGVLILVTGISLFIGYSLTQLGPAGRVAIGFGAGAALLAAGVAFERRARYVIFGRGLIGGGWAALYFTTYAMYGLDAARVIASPWVATGLLVAVAAAMILHSLRYRAQTVTGLGYVVGFATLAIAPVSTFALAATVPLAATLVWVAYRFSWVAMAVVGLVTTYGVFAVTAEPVSGVGIAQFAREQLILALYWLMFEAFDLLSERRADRARVARLLFPLNASAFLGVSLIRWTAVTPATLSVFLGIAAAAYLVSASCRALLLRRALARPAVDATLDVHDRSYRAPVTVAMVLAIAAIFVRFEGLQVHLALLLAGQLAFLAGLRFGDAYLRWLAGAPFAILLYMLVVIDAWTGVRAPVGGWRYSSGPRWRY